MKLSDSTVEKHVFIADLENLLSGKLGEVDFERKYLVGPSVVEVESITDGSISYIIDNLGHYVADADVRAKDKKYKEMQEHELKKLIYLLKSNAPPADIEKITFLTYSDRERRPSLSAKLFGLAIAIAVAGIVTLILKLLY